MFRRAISRAVSTSPLCPCSEPQQCCILGVTTSQPFASSTSTVSRFTREYELFVATLAQWSRLTDAWYTRTREQIVHRWEEASFRTETRAILYQLRMQHRRLQLLGAQLA